MSLVSDGKVEQTEKILTYLGIHWLRSSWVEAVQRIVFQSYLGKGFSASVGEESEEKLGQAAQRRPVVPPSA